MRRGKRLEDVLGEAVNGRDECIKDSMVFFLSMFGGKAWIGSATGHVHSAIYVARKFGSDIRYSHGWLEAGTALCNDI